MLLPVLVMNIERFQVEALICSLDSGRHTFQCFVLFAHERLFSTRLHFICVSQLMRSLFSSHKQETLQERKKSLTSGVDYLHLIPVKCHVCARNNFICTAFELHLKENILLFIIVRCCWFALMMQDCALSGSCSKTENTKQKDALSSPAVSRVLSSF